jgi:hypothetical protein
LLRNFDISSRPTSPLEQYWSAEQPGCQQDEQAARKARKLLEEARGGPGFCDHEKVLRH